MKYDYSFLLRHSELRDSRCGVSHTLFEGVNNTVHHFTHLSSYFDKVC